MTMDPMATRVMWVVSEKVCPKCKNGTAVGTEKLGMKSECKWNVRHPCCFQFHSFLVGGFNPLEKY